MDATPSCRYSPQEDDAQPLVSPTGTLGRRPPSSAVTSCASSRVLLDLEDVDMLNENEELMNVETDLPSRPSKKRSWTWEHFTKVPGDHENPQAR